ncbi:transketolase [Sulfobacillus acidophilus TPY]|uniref:Transketolase n=2 Tax=Sulfobacillus acidophilus TaxID=53633 RepID=G8TZ53_SULAD|nr:transketolase [Sulfobacillus acidophilus TPY]AEW06323.1 transketolase [Sulfobacillus acidophilus DSM 10332]
MMAINNPSAELDQRMINTLRTLAIDAVEQANSGHPGMPMGAAPMAHVLWTRFLRHNPKNPRWVNRDRFILSAGHGSMLLYALLYLTGYDISLDDLKRFRQWGSKAAGHPEYGWTPGVETTTGPLGQGFATGVGMAIAERHLAARYNQPGFPLIDHYTYAIVSDGDLMEGIASEAASLAGHLKLGKLIYLYDNNHISIEGTTDVAFTENVGARFKAYGWHVLTVDDGNDIQAIHEAIVSARSTPDQPSLIMVRTHIGYGSPNKQDTPDAHGAPLGKEEARLAKQAYGWPEDQPFWVPTEVLSQYRTQESLGPLWERQWQTLWREYQQKFPELARSLRSIWEADSPSWPDVPPFPSGQEMATRTASGRVINLIADQRPHFIGGSADLGPSNETRIKNGGDFTPDTPDGRNLHFGVREHAMGALLNGISLHGEFRVFGGTFLIFSDYMLPAMRLAALMHQPVTYVLTHDSIGVGEDGPTHQPIEQVTHLRAIPNLVLIRPADANETREAWRLAFTSQSRPVALALTRQKVPVLDADRTTGVAQGAYILEDASTGRPRCILLASGSEVHLALAARQTLEAKGIPTRVVSMPSWALFEEQSDEYRQRVIPPDVPARIAIEAASPLGWDRYVGPQGQILAMRRFGASAPGPELYRQFGFTPENIVAIAESLVASLDLDRV